MEPTVLGLVLDSSAVITAERKRQPVVAFIEGILASHGPVELSLSPVTVAELAHGIYRAKSREAAEKRRAFLEELFRLVPVHPITTESGWLAGRIEGQEAERGNVIPFSDLMIGVAAIEQGYAVLTGNTRHFRKIPGLLVVPL